MTCYYEITGEGCDFSERLVLCTDKDKIEKIFKEYVVGKRRMPGNMDMYCADYIVLKKVNTDDEGTVLSQEELEHVTFSDLAWWEKAYEEYMDNLQYVDEGHDYNEMCKNIVEEDKWCYDDMLLQLNHGQCFNDGRYESTTDADWELFTEAVKEAVKEDRYTETMYNRIKARLVERDGYASL